MAARAWGIVCVAFSAVSCGGGETLAPAPVSAAPGPAVPEAPTPSVDVAAREGRWLRNIRQLTRQGRKSGESYFDPTGTQLLFMSVPDDYPFFQIYRIAVAGDAPAVRVSTGRGKTTCPYFHPDGTRFLYASTHLDPALDAKEAAARAEVAKPPAAGKRYAWDFDDQMDIFEARLDGTILRQLTDTLGYDAECAYAPDGSRIVFTSGRDGELDIYTMAADGTDVRRVTALPGYDGGPFFSPDGRRIVWRGDRRGDDKLQVFVADTDGGNVRQLTDNTAVNWGPYFHPDGRRLIYATSRHGHQNYELYLVDIESGREERVTFWGGFDGLPAFSADGRLLCWTSRRGGADSQVFVAEFVDAWAGDPAAPR